MTEGKTCSKCKVWKIFGDFYKDRRKNNGYRSDCKVCNEKKSVEYRKLNAEKVAQKQRKYYEENKEILNKKHREYFKKYYQLNKKKVIEATTKYYKVNEEKVREYKKEYKEKNKDAIVAQSKEYRNSEKGKNSGHNARLKRRSHEYKVRFYPHERTKLLNRDNWTCQCCGIKVHDGSVNDEFKCHIDHIKPISKGGDSEPKNLRVLCRTCNLSKGNNVDEQLQLTL